MALELAKLVAHIEADTSKFDRAIDQASGKFDGFGGVVKTGALAIAAVGAAAGAGIVAGLGAAVTAASGFEETMSAVKAVSGATGDEMDQLGKLALQLGKDTSFSASEAAKGMEELIKGGLTIEDVLGGGAKAALDLAAAGGISLGEAATIAANAVGQFGLKGQDLPRVADLIAGAANASSLDVSDFKFSLAAAGAVANTVGFSFEDLAQGIAVMGKAGIKGSDAGTSLKTMMLNLQPSTKEATARMKELGLITEDGANAFFDAQGKVKSMAEVAGILKNATAGLTQQQKLATLETIFGSDAIRAAAVFANEGAEGFGNMAAEMGKVTAASVGAEKLNNLRGSLEQLKGSLETAAITVGMALIPALRGIIDWATSVVNNAMPALEGLAAGFTAALVQVQGAFERTGIAGALAQIIQHVFGLSEAATGDLTNAFLGVAGVFGQFAAVVSDAFGRALAVVQKFRDDFVGGFQDGGLIEAFRSAISNLVFSAFGESAFWPVQNFFNTVRHLWTEFMAGFRVEGLRGGALNLVNELFGENAMIRLDDFITQVRGILQSLWTSAVNIFQSLVATVVPLVQGFIADLSMGFQKVQPIALELVSSFQSLAQFAQMYLVPALREIAQIVIDHLLPTLFRIAGFVVSEIIPTLLQFHSTIRTAVLPMLMNLAEFVLTNVVPAIRDLARSIESWVNEILPLVGPALKNILGIITTVVGAISSFWAEHWNTIREILQAAWNAARMIVESALTLIGGIIKAALQIIGGDWAGAWETMKETGLRILGIFQRGLFDMLGGILSMVPAVAGAIGKAIFDGIVGGLGGLNATIWGLLRKLGETIVGFVQDIWNRGFNIGASLMDGIKRGIAALWDGAMKMVGDFLRSLPDEAKKVLQISSPSRIFEQIGKEVVAGFVGGIQDNASLANTAVGQLVGALPGTAAAPTSTGGTALARPLATSGSALAAGGGAGIHVHLEGANIYGITNLQDAVVNAIETARRQGRQI